MSKMSTEIAALRRAIVDAIAGAPALRLATFVQGDGDPIAVNPDHVASVEQRGPTKTTIKMRDGSSHTVEEAFADVTDKLQE